MAPGAHGCAGGGRGLQRQEVSLHSDLHLRFADGAGAWLDLAPDRIFGTKIESPTFEVMLERRGRLNIAMAEGTNDMLLAAGEVRRG